MSADTATETRPSESPVAEEVLAASPGYAYLWKLSLPVRPATPEEAAEYEARKTDVTFALSYGDPYGILPPPLPAPVSPMASPRPYSPPKPAAEATVPEAPAVPAVAQEAADRLGLGELDEDKQKALASFTETHDAEDKRVATAEIAAIGDDTAVISDGAA